MPAFLEALVPEALAILVPWLLVDSFGRRGTLIFATQSRLCVFLK